MFVAFSKGMFSGVNKPITKKSQTKYISCHVHTTLKAWSNSTRLKHSGWSTVKK